MSDVITVPSHTKKDNPKAALKPRIPVSPSVTQPCPYIVIPDDRGQPGSRRDHQPRPGRHTAAARQQPRTRSYAQGRPRRPGDPRRSRHHPWHDGRRTRSSTLDAERAQAAAPPDVSRQLRLTAQAEADARRQSADAAYRRDEAEAANAKALADQLAAELQQLEAVNTRYEQWSADTARARETAAKARAELERRSLLRQPAEPSQPQAANEHEADMGTLGHNVGSERKHQIVVTIDNQRLPEQTPEPELAPQNSLAVAAPDTDAQLGPHCEATQLDELLAKASEAAGRIAADRAECEARTDCIARIQREARAQPEPILESQAKCDMEIEL